MLRMGIREVYETPDFREANNLLKQGWQLSDIYHGENGCVYVLCFINRVGTDN